MLIVTAADAMPVAAVVRPTGMRAARAAPGSVLLARGGDASGGAGGTALLLAVTSGRLPLVLETWVRRALRNAFALAQRHGLPSLAVPLAMFATCRRSHADEVGHALRVLREELQRSGHAGEVALVLPGRTLPWLRRLVAPCLRWPWLEAGALWVLWNTIVTFVPPSLELRVAVRDTDDRALAGARVTVLAADGSITDLGTTGARGVVLWPAAATGDPLWHLPRLGSYALPDVRLRIDAEERTHTVRLLDLLPLVPLADEHAQVHIDLPPH